jgi:hypothetical protein
MAPSPQEICIVNAIIPDFAMVEPTCFPSHGDVEYQIVGNTDSFFAAYYTVGVRPVRSSDLPVCTVAPDEAVFASLVQRWYAERGATSSITEMAMCHSYQRIIGMGEKAIPLILRQLEAEGEDPDHWFWALQALTGTNPVPPDARGDMREMARAWLDWAYLKGYAW